MAGPSSELEPHLLAQVPLAPPVALTASPAPGHAQPGEAELPGRLSLAAAAATLCLPPPPRRCPLPARRLGVERASGWALAPLRRAASGRQRLPGPGVLARLLPPPSAAMSAGGGGLGTPRALPSSGPRALRDMPHPLAASSSEEAASELTPSPDLLLPRSFADKDLSLPNGTPVDTSSPASSSSLLNRLQLDDDLDGETRDLFVTVDDPKKHICTMETYITYRVTTKTTRAEFDLPEYSVRRRYQDFDWLRNKLEESQPTHLIPPLPEKFVMKGVVDRFSEEFVETRRKALDKFLKRIADHPVLSFNEHFNVFLTAKDLNAYKKQGMALLSKMGESVKYVTGGYKLRSRPPEFAAIGDYLDTFVLKLGTIDRIAQRIIKEELEYLVELREYGPVYSTWGGLEVELAEPLEGVSACIGNCSTALEELSDDMTEDFLPVLREYILYSESMKNVLKKRDQVQAEYEAKLEAVALKKEDRPKVPADVEKCQDRVECFNADLKADMERWQNNKRQDFRQLLMGMADKNIQYYEKCLTAWESIIPLLQDKPETK
ncbi:isoleucine--tRNA ligase, mitochondrial [Platysternon megacephalum]|uniref:Sorting nexin-30 n=1 Tax=Platysternon megacephalum TaxID=55544 RepID=A0A4D9EWH1_9SAUR|nr:isoleucine--tRNA ligase, mitochondrial [Platysternon megacephalum]